MKPLNLILFSLVLVPAFPLMRSQGITKPVIPVHAPPLQTPAEPLVPIPLPPPAEGTATLPGQPPGAAIAPTTALPGALAVPANYVIGPQDNLSVSVWKEPSVSGNVEVRTDGMISLPLLGDVKATEFTPIQLAQDLTDRLRKFINDPLVTVTVVAVNSKKIYFAGQGIARPGPAVYDPNITPLQAILSAGGITQFAHEKKIYILRSVAGKTVTLHFDYKKALKTGDQQGLRLLPGDTIVVP